MEEKENIVCDFTTGICGPADAEADSCIIEFIDLTAKDEEETEE